jgi:hypothetical protein
MFCINYEIRFQQNELDIFLYRYKHRNSNTTFLILYIAYKATKLCLKLPILSTNSKLNIFLIFVRYINIEKNTRIYTQFI